MSKLECYILKRYGRWIPYSVASEELGFSVVNAVDACINKACRAGKEAQEYKNATTGEISFRGGFMTPRMFDITYNSFEFVIDSLSVDIINDRLLFTELARLLNLNLHLDLGYEPVTDSVGKAIENGTLVPRRK